MEYGTTTSLLVEGAEEASTSTDSAALAAPTSGRDHGDVDADAATARTETDAALEDADLKKSRRRRECDDEAAMGSSSFSSATVIDRNEDDDDDDDDGIRERRGGTRTVDDDGGCRGEGVVVDHAEAMPKTSASATSKTGCFVIWVIGELYYVVRW